MLTNADADVDHPHLYLNAAARDSVASNGKESFTIDEAADRLIGGLPGWSNVLGVGFTVTYAFRSTAPTVMPEDAGGFARFSAAQILQAEQALRAWSDVANISFQRVGEGVSGEAAYSDNATILLADYTTGVSGASAFAYSPGYTTVRGLRTPQTGAQYNAGDVWINSTYSSNRTPTGTNYGGQVLVHELGHAIGLDHPSAYDASNSGPITYASDASYYEDSRQYTVMSYFSESNTGGNFAGLYASSPLLDDIAAAQREYGANLTTRTGDTVYGFNSNAERSWFITDSSATKLVFAVWDAGGHDTFDFSGYFNDQLIDLRAGNFSNVGGLTGNVAVAQGVTIEDAVGGSGADRIYGNDAGNMILGGLGNDTIVAGAGANVLRGGEGDDSIQGGSGFDDMIGNQGADTLRGGDGDDWVVGGKDNDLLYGENGGDIVLGNLGDDTVDGGAGNDQVRGGQGADVVLGGAGNDWLSGDLGDDTLTGGAGADIFHSWGGAGLDWVTDFNQAEGDRVLLDAGTVYTVSQINSDTVIDMVGGARMILAGVQLSTLATGWIYEV